MLRYSYRPTATRTVVSHGKLDTLPPSGDRITLDNQPYAVDRVVQEGIAASISVRVAP
jgi:hypothetical protein